MIGKLLSKEECAKCRICCSFDSYDLWETPYISKTLASKILQEYEPEVKFVKKDSHFLLKMNKEPEADLYFCSLLDREKGCVLDSDKPFDCKIWPLRVMQLNDKKVITLSPVCPSVWAKPMGEIIEVAKELSKAIFEYANENPDAVKPYLKDYPILVVDDSKYSDSLI